MSSTPESADTSHHAGTVLDPKRGPSRWRAFNIRKEYSEFPVRFRE
jgi:hypothetical protein